MKNLTNRTKILLGIAGLVIVVIVVGLVLLGSGAADLLGSAVIHISPQNPTIAVGQILDLSINSVGNCFWSVPGYDVAVLYYGVGSSGVVSTGITDSDTKNVRVRGEGPGQVVVTAKCFMFTRSTTITVH